MTKSIFDNDKGKNNFKMAVSLSLEYLGEELLKSALNMLLHSGKISSKINLPQNAPKGISEERWKGFLNHKSFRGDTTNFQIKFKETAYNLHSLLKRYYSSISWNNNVSPSAQSDFPFFNISEIIQIENKLHHIDLKEPNEVVTSLIQEKIEEAYKVLGHKIYRSNTFIFLLEIASAKQIIWLNSLIGFSQSHNKNYLNRFQGATTQSDLKTYFSHCSLGSFIKSYLEESEEKQSEYKYINTKSLYVLEDCLKTQQSLREQAADIFGDSKSRYLRNLNNWNQEIKYTQKIGETYFDEEIIYFSQRVPDNYFLLCKE